MRTRRLHLTTFLVLFPVTLGIAFWVALAVSRLVCPLETKKDIGSWNKHYSYLTPSTTGTMATSEAMAMTTSSNIHSSLLDYLRQHIIYFIGMVLFFLLVICLSIIASRSFDKMPYNHPFDVRTWKQTLQVFIKVNQDEPSSPKSASSPISSHGLSSSSQSKQDIQSQQQQQQQQEGEYRFTHTMIKNTTAIADDMSTGSTETSVAPTAAATSTIAETPSKDQSKIHQTATTVDKRKKKRPKQPKKKERSNKPYSPSFSKHEEKGDTPTPAQKHIVSTSTTSVSHQSIAVSPAADLTGSFSPPTPTLLTITTTPLSTPPVTQQSPATPEPTPITTSSSESTCCLSAMPSPCEKQKRIAKKAPKKQEHAQAQPASSSSRAPSSSAEAVPMITKIIPHGSNNSSSCVNVGVSSSISTMPSPPSQAEEIRSVPSSLSSVTPAVTAVTTSNGSSRQSWYSPFSTGLEFDLLSRSPPSPAHTYASNSSSSSPPLSASSSMNFTDYRLFTDSTSSRPSSSTLCGSGNYHTYQHHHHHHTHQTHQIHQTHHYPQHLQHHQHHLKQPYHPNQSHPTYMSHQNYLNYQGHTSLFLKGNNDLCDQHQAVCGPTSTSLPSSSPSSSSSSSSSYMESSSTIARLPPPTSTGQVARLPSPPIPSSPVIAPPTLSSSSVAATTTTPSTCVNTLSYSSRVSPAFFPLSSWYPWTPRSDYQGSSQLHQQHQQQQQQQQQSQQEQQQGQDGVSVYGQPTTSTFSLFDRKLSFHSFHSASQSGRSASQDHV